MARRILLASALTLLASSGCDRSTPRLPFATAAPTVEATPTVRLSTLAPSDAPSPTAADARMPRPPAGARRARVLRVSDGDTIVLSGIDVGEVDASTGGRKARLIGVDTPEVFGGVECYGRQASDFTKRTLDGAPVLVDLDVDPVDRYGRALVYVWESSGAFFNGRLAAEGYAYQATFPPNVRYVELFRQLVADARSSGAGLWAAGTCA